MTDLLLRIGGISSALALVAWAVQSMGKRPLVAAYLKFVARSPGAGAESVSLSA